jgi:DHA1 family tetracycline resistance protein-like MFS transporter
MYTVIFMGFIGYSLMTTIFTPMILNAKIPYFALFSNSKSFRTIILGLILFLYPLGQFLGAPILGALSDRYGRKSILLKSLFLGLIFYIGISLGIYYHLFVLLLCSLFLAGLCEANVAIAQGAITDLSPKEERTRYFGYIYVAASLAFVVGPLVGGKLADPKLSHLFNYATPFMAVCILLLLTLLWILFFFKETHEPDASSSVHWFDALKNMANIIKSKKLRPFYGINFLTGFAMFGFFRCYPMYLVDKFHMDVSQESEFIAWVSVPIILTNVWLVGYLSKRFALKKIIFISSLLLGISLFIFLIPNREYALWITLFFPALFIGLLMPTCAGLLSLQAKSAEQGAVMGNNQSLALCAEAVSALFAGLLAAWFIQLPIIALGIIAFLVFFLITRIKVAQ